MTAKQHLQSVIVFESLTSAFSLTGDPSGRIVGRAISALRHSMVSAARVVSDVLVGGLGQLEPGQCGGQRALRRSARPQRSTRPLQSRGRRSRRVCLSQGSCPLQARYENVCVFVCVRKARRRMSKSDDEASLSLRIASRSAAYLQVYAGDGAFLAILTSERRAADARPGVLFTRSAREGCPRSSPLPCNREATERSVCRISRTPELESAIRVALRKASTTFPNVLVLPSNLIYLKRHFRRLTLALICLPLPRRHRSARTEGCAAHREHARPGPVDVVAARQDAQPD